MLRTACEILSVILPLLLWQGTNAGAATPSLFYSLLTVNLSKEDYLKRALCCRLKRRSQGKLMKRSDDVALVDKEY